MLMRQAVMTMIVLMAMMLVILLVIPRMIQEWWRPQQQVRQMNPGGCWQMNQGGAGLTHDYWDVDWWEAASRVLVRRFVRARCTGGWVVSWRFGRVGRGMHGAICDSHQGYILRFSTIDMAPGHVPVSAVCSTPQQQTPSSNYTTHRPSLQVPSDNPWGTLSKREPRVWWGGKMVTAP